jgi:SAM-dependent methyltransferase
MKCSTRRPTLRDTDEEWQVNQGDPRWFETFSGVARPHPAPRGRHRRRGRLIVAVTSPPPGAAILDLACGHGRHSLKLARRGFAVAGVDLSEPSLEIARRAASEDDIDITFVHDDMREISFKAEFDVAINMFTAFGYFDEEGDHERALSAARAPSRTTGSSCSTPSIRYGCSAISIPRRSAASTTAPCSSRSVTTTRCAAVLRRRGHSSGPMGPATSSGTRCDSTRSSSCALS